MRATEFLVESKQTSLNQLYNGNYPDRDEIFWDYVTKSELDQPLVIQTMSKHNLLITLLSQYRVEHIDEITDMLDAEQQEIVQSYMNNPNLSNSIIVVSNDRIIDGNHRALAAALAGKPINYVDLSDLDIELTEEENYNLPSTIYHVTPTRNLYKIKQIGLIPQIGDRSGKISSEVPAIYCFPSITEVEDALMNWLGDEFDDEQLSLLAINTVGLFGNYTPNAEYEIAITSKIPPKNIKIITTDL